MNLAFDRKSVRTFDVDGRLHVAINNISKASVDPYYGREIPGYEALKLNPDKVYYLLRHPDELAKAAPSFNNLPILAEHMPVSADEHMPELVIGSTGTDAEFVEPFLRNSAVVWARDAIDDIEAEEKREWSCGYRYTPDMTPGSYKGLQYDGIMRDIVGNHVALVRQGRAGPEVIVGDSLPKGVRMLNSRKALLLHGALIAGLAPRVANIGKVDFAGALDSVTASNLAKKAPAIAAAVVKAVKPALAADEGLDVSDVTAIISAVQGATAAEPVEDDDLNPIDEDGDKPAVDADDDPMGKVMAYLKGKVSDEDLAECAKLAGRGAMDADEDDDAKDKPGAYDMDKDDKNKPAMDAAAIQRAAVRTVAAIREAEAAVEPHIGKLAVAMDSAEGIYRLALENAGVALDGVPPAAFKAMVAMLPAPNDAPAPRVAMDAGTVDDFRARFPTAATLIRS
jgi:hypothetical protein